jgi:hypothetical protein
MHSKITLVAAALAAFAPVAFADRGKAIIKNQCAEPVHVWSIAGDAEEKTSTIEGGGEWSEDYRENDNGGGISIKLSYDESHDDVSQFEYTLAPSENKVYYDLSNIDGYPFRHGGTSIKPSDDSCPAVNCPAGVKECKDAYNMPFDDHATKGCSEDADLTLVLCSDEKGSKKRVVRNIPHPRNFERRQ